MVFIGASACAAMETNQAPSWLRYTEDQEDAREDWGPVEPGVVRPHHGCTRTPISSPWFEFRLGSFACLGILVMLVSDYDLT